MQASPTTVVNLQNQAVAQSRDFNEEGKFDLQKVRKSQELDKEKAMTNSVKKQKNDMHNGRRSATIEASPKYEDKDQNKELSQSKSLAQIIDENNQKAKMTSETPAIKREGDLDNTRLINEVFDNIFNNDQNKFNLVSERNKIQLPLLTATDKAKGIKEQSISGGE